MSFAYNAIDIALTTLGELDETYGALHTDIPGAVLSLDLEARRDRDILAPCDYAKSAVERGRQAMVELLSEAVHNLEADDVVRVCDRLWHTQQAAPDSLRCDLLRSMALRRDLAGALATSEVMRHVEASLQRCSRRDAAAWLRMVATLRTTLESAGATRRAAWMKKWWEHGPAQSLPGRLATGHWSWATQVFFGPQVITMDPAVAVQADLKPFLAHVKGARERLQGLSEYALVPEASTYVEAEFAAARPETDQLAAADAKAWIHLARKAQGLPWVTAWALAGLRQPVDTPWHTEGLALLAQTPAQGRHGRIA